jgi:hypothetical protein
MDRPGSAEGPCWCEEGSSPLAAKRRSWRGTCTRLGCLAGCQPARCATTTSRLRSRRWSGRATGGRTTAGLRSGSHYGLEAFYCQPGRDGAHEKGGVEGEVGRFRRNHLVPVPEVDSLAQLNAMVDRWCAEDDQRRIGTRPRTVAEAFAAEQPALRPLPEEPFATGRVFTPRVDRYGQVTVRMNRYCEIPMRRLQAGLTRTATGLVP